MTRVVCPDLRSAPRQGQISSRTRGARPSVCKRASALDADRRRSALIRLAALDWVAESRRPLLRCAVHGRYPWAARRNKRTLPAVHLVNEDTDMSNLHSRPFLMILLTALMVAGCAATPGKISVTKPVPELNTADGLALRGYDAVAYFTDGKPVRGSDAHTYEWRGAKWTFASAQHRDAFVSDPGRYAPAFGGYCAFAVSRGTTADGDPHQWAVVDDKLYLNTNAFAQQLWNNDRPGNIAAGAVNWPLIPKAPAVP